MILNLTQLTVEVSYFKFYIGRGVDLDNRIKLPEAVRIKEYFTVFLLSLVLLAIVMPVSLLAVPMQSCALGFYIRPGSTDCTDCTFTLTPQCLACTDGLNCTSCVTGSYLDAGRCFDCSNLTPGCKSCSKNECLNC